MCDNLTVATQSLYHHRNLMNYIISNTETQLETETDPRHNFSHKGGGGRMSLAQIDNF